MMLKRSIGGLIAALAMMIGVEALAQTSPQTGTLVVTATVANSCGITTSTMAFGTFTPGTPIVRAIGNLTVTCTLPGDLHVALGAGENDNGSYRMAGPNGSFLPYTLESYDGISAYTPWYNSTIDILNASAGVTNFGLRGSIVAAPAGLTAAGAHTDNIAINFTF